MIRLLSRLFGARRSDSIQRIRETDSERRNRYGREQRKEEIFENRTAFWRLLAHVWDPYSLSLMSWLIE